MQRSRANPRATLVILVGLTALYIGLIWWSWGRWGDVLVDSGTAIDRAARVADGQRLYRDVLSPYGPVATQMVAAAFRLFGTHLTTVYSIGIAVLFAQGLMLWSIGRRLLGDWESAFGVLIFWALLGVQPVLTSWILSNTFASIFGGLFATATLLVCLSDLERSARWKPVAASVLAALAGLTKIEFGAAAVGTLLLAVGLCDRPRRQRLWAIGAALVPGASITAAVAAWLCWTVPVEQLLHDNLYRRRTLDLIVSATRSWGELPVWPRVAVALARYGVELPLRAAALATGVVLARRGGVRSALGVTLFVVAALVPILPGYPEVPEFLGLRRGLPYYWAPIGWVAVGAIAVFSLRRSPSTRARALVLVAAFAVLLSLRWNLRMRLASYYSFLGPILLLVMVRATASALLRRSVPQWAVVAVLAMPLIHAQTVNVEAFRRRSLAVTYPRGTILDVPQRARPLQRVIDHVRQHTRASDFVAVIPEERIINFLSERRNPTRDSGIGPKYLAGEADERAYIGELESHATAMVVLSGRQFPEFGFGDVASYNPLVIDHLHRHYRIAATIGAGLQSYQLFVPRRARPYAR